MTYGIREIFGFHSKLAMSFASLVFAGLVASCADAEDNAQEKDVKQNPTATEKSIPAAESSAASHKSVSADVLEPADYRLNDYRSPVPATLKDARVIEGEEARVLHKDNAAVFIDVYPRAPKPPNLPKNTVWRDPPHMSIKGAHWLPNVGYGVLAPHVETYFKKHLERLTGGDKAKPVAFFCLKDCWMSWNAGKRAVEWGYTSVIWFADGTDGWQEAGASLTPIKVVKD